MRVSPMIYFAIAIAVLGYVVAIASSREKFQPEFLDKAQVRRTAALEDSSFSQRTNHVVPAAFSMGPISGTQSPFQVNQYKAYIA